MRREKRISSPDDTGLSSSKTTPPAETFRVIAAISSLPEDKTTGSASGKRTAQRTSCWGEARRERAAVSGKADFNVSIVGIQDPKRVITTLPEFFLPSRDTKVSQKVMCGLVMPTPPD